MVYSGEGFFLLFKPPKCVCEPCLGRTGMIASTASFSHMRCLLLRPNTTIGVGRYVHEMGIDDTDHVAGPNQGSSKPFPLNSDTTP